MSLFIGERLPGQNLAGKADSASFPERSNLPPFPPGDVAGWPVALLAWLEGYAFETHSDFDAKVYGRRWLIYCLFWELSSNLRIVVLLVPKECVVHLAGQNDDFVLSDWPQIHNITGEIC